MFFDEILSILIDGKSLKYLFTQKTTAKYWSSTTIFFFKDYFIDCVCLCLSVSVCLFFPPSVYVRVHALALQMEVGEQLLVVDSFLPSYGPEDLA